MSPRIKQRMKSAGVWAAAVAIMGFAGPRVADATITAVDSRYAHADTFQTFRVEVRTKALVDSLNRRHDMDIILARFARLDSASAQIRACQRRRGACE